MSAKRFIQYLQGNPEMQASLSAEGWTISAVVAAGAAAGFEFNSEEYRAAYREVASEELAAVTGGLAAAGGCGPAWKKTSQF